MKRYSFSELHAFVERANTMDRIFIAYEYLEKLTYLSAKMYDELMSLLFSKEREIEDEMQERYYQIDRDMYSPSCPWNAPGMCASDFI